MFSLIPEIQNTHTYTTNYITKRNILIENKLVVTNEERGKIRVRN